MKFKQFAASSQVRHDTVNHMDVTTLRTHLDLEKNGFIRNIFTFFRCERFTILLEKIKQNKNIIVLTYYWTNVKVYNLQSHLKKNANPIFLQICGFNRRNNAMPRK